jgi:hypothetical protein
MLRRLLEQLRRNRREPDHAQTKAERLEEHYEARLLSRHGDVRAEDLWPTKHDDKQQP